MSALRGWDLWMGELFETDHWVEEFDNDLDLVASVLESMDGELPEVVAAAVLKKLNEHGRIVVKQAASQR